MNSVLKKIYFLLSMQAGFDPRKLLYSLRGLPRFVSGWLQFRKRYTGKLNLLPCLHDWYEEGGSAKGEYFWQDLHVAQKIHQANPIKHVDIGSRLDGFVAHVASFREVEVFDIRPITPVIPRVTFKQADLMSPTRLLTNYCDSISCLHALEHFGLGRYGDPIDPEGYAAGFKNMAAILRSGGVFYLSVPIGIERVEFNAHRIFDPQKLVKVAASHGLELQEFASIQPGKTLIESANPMATIAELGEKSYALGIFTYIKI
jgi:SAM-dependent methyltransferase